MKTRTLTSTVLSAFAATTLLAGAALATTTVAPDSDATPASAAEISQLARTTTAVGEAKGDAISAAAKALDPDAMPAAPTSTDAQGDTISALARNTAAGPEHGEAVSSAASAGSSAERSSVTAPGAAISHLATTTTASGEAKGDAISTAARTNRSTR